MALFMSITEVFTVAKMGKQCKHPFVDEQLKKMWLKCTMKYYSAVKNKVLTCGATQIKLTGIMPSEINQTEKKYHVISLKCRIEKKNVWIHRTNQ